MRKNTKGFSLIEILIVLAIMIGISAIVFFTYNKINENKNVEETAQFLNLSSIMIQDNYRNYKDISLSDLKPVGVLDFNQPISNEEIKNKFGGVLSLSEYEDGEGFNFRLTNVEKGNCIKLLQRVNNNYSFVNDEAFVTKDLKEYETLCNLPEINLAYKNNFLVKSIHTGFSATSGQANIYSDMKDAIGKENSYHVDFDNGGITIKTSNSKDNDLARYVYNKSHMQDKIESAEYPTTGYRQSSCSNNYCGDLNADDTLNALLNAPDEYWENSGTHVYLKTKSGMHDEMQKETVSKICKKFTCSEPDKNGVINITNKK